VKLTNEQQKIVEDNLALVHYVVNKQYNGDEDYASIGTLGLIKGVATFDESKGYCRSTYLIKCIRNEIYWYYRNDKNPKNTLSLDLEYEDCMTLENLVPSEIDIERDIIEDELHQRLFDNIAKLNDTEQYILNNYYGLGNRTRISLKVIAENLNMSQSKATKMHLKALKKLKSMMEDRNV
jgi:RNA polymerase sporulation-specific sigma factor